ncbi:MAG TPA: hypothetical protein VFB73_18885 [Chloroflexota bacterium]|nr:hypothetical protein [Chloroflexota bacterium]HZU08031.1 hypothetical protein [Chloroflexota bacterium]
MRLVRIGSILGAVALLSVAAAPAALAAPLGQHHFGFRNGFRDGFRIGHPVVVPVPAPVPAVAVPVPAPVAAVPVPVAAPVAAVAVPAPVAAVPVPVPVVQAVLPALQQVFPTAGFAQNPPQFIPLQGNTYAVSSPLLFCGADQAGTCQLMAQQLAQVTPGWGTTLMNGPQGYGVYLTYQNS